MIYAGFYKNFGVITASIPEQRIGKYKVGESELQAKSWNTLSVMLQVFILQGKRRPEGF